MKRTLVVIIACLALTACTSDEVFSVIDIAIQASANIEQAVGLLNPSDAAWLSKADSDAQSALNQIKADYDTYESTCKTTCDQSILAQAQAVAQTLESTMELNLQAMQISDPATLAKARGWYSLVIDAADFVLAIESSTTKPKPINVSANSLKKTWDFDVCNGVTPCKALVKIHRRRIK
jgi:hypothetical protein